MNNVSKLINITVEATSSYFQTIQPTIKYQISKHSYFYNLKSNQEQLQPIHT
jgi:hypothetical protein